MITISYSPSDVLFTYQLPTSISIALDLDQVTVSVACQGVTVFSTVLYAFKNKATLYDIRSIVEQYLIEKKRSYARVTIMANGEKESATSVNIKTVIYSHVTLNSTAQAFCPTHFLSTAVAEALPKDCRQTMYYMAAATGTITTFYDCLVRPTDGTAPRVYRISEKSKSITQGTAYTISIYASSMIATTKGYGTLLAFTAHYGLAAKTFYLTDRQPDLTLQVYNEFNVLEYVYLNAVTKHVTEFDRDFALTQGQNTFYDDTTYTENETETAFLTFAEATRLARLLLAPVLYIYEDGIRLEIIITDLTSEISDAHNATNSIKFKWKYRTPQLRHHLKSELNTFDDTYSREYD